MLVQSADDGRVDVAAAKVVTQRQPTAAELRDLKFAWTVVKYVKSNAIVLARDGATIGIGAGQPSRVMSARIAALKAEEAKLDVAGTALASDAFFPFRDGIDAAAERGVLRDRAARRVHARRRSRASRRRARHDDGLHGHAALPPLRARSEAVKILLIGNGGREHALAWKLAQSPKVSEVLCAPGNAGTAGEPKTRNVPIAVTDFAALIEVAKKERVALTVVGPEVPLVGGIVDTFEAAGLKCFGPRGAGAQLEGSKAFTKEFLARHRIPTAAYRTFTDFARRARLRRDANPADRHQSGRAGGRQRRHHRADASGG